MFGVFLTILSDATYQQVIGAGAIVFCFTRKLLAIIEALDLYEILSILKRNKSLVIFYQSEAALHDANAVAYFILREKYIPVKHQICNTNGYLLMKKTIARLTKGHHRRMKIDRDGRITHRYCDNCLNKEQIPADLLDCPAILAALQEIGILFRQQISM
ncbi:hypothetical protein TNCV_1351281 [Trichonephila clavipes]|nr:hypothetical protein TNCV_1351281 [Trichonephila clavipes]